jgi:hypothetical protein
MNLKDSWTNLIKYQNGEAVGRRMAQLLELSLRSEYEHLYPSVQTIWKAVEGREENLLGRSFDDIRQTGRVTQEFEESMRQAGNEDWDTFRQEISLTPITDKEASRIIADGSGLVRNTHFEEWVLGKTEKPVDPETIIDKAKTLRKEG